MARTPSNMLALGTKAFDFSLYSPLDNKMYDLQSLRGDKGTVIFFICNHCPFVIHVLEELVKLSNDYQSQGINFIAINSNDIVNYPDDSPEKMVTLIEEYKIPFPYLFDETQEVAKIYDAACTPDNYLFDSELNLVYRGQLDHSRPGNGIPVTGEDIRYAMDCLLKDVGNDKLQKPSLGCNIKWKN